MIYCRHEWKGYESDAENDLTAAFQKCIAGMREQRSIPNVWQEHLLKLLKLIGYAQDEVFDSVENYFADADPDVKRTFNQYARGFWNKNIFIDVT